MSTEIIFYDRNTIGPHINFLGNLENTIKSGSEILTYTVQFMLGSPYSYSRSEPSKLDLKKTREILDNNPINVFVHSPYIFNLAGSQKLKKLAWTDCLETNNKVNLSIKGLEQELLVTSLLKNKWNNTGVVLHPGSWGTGKNENETKLGLDAVVKSINKIKFPENSILLLETMVGKGGVLGISYEQLKYMLEHVNECQKKHLKICVDTCHIFANGSFDLRTKEGVDKVFSDFIKIFGSLDLLGLIHLNDSCDPYCSGIDHHALLTKGNIWKDNFETLQYLLDKIQMYQIPTVCETHPFDYQFMQSIPIKN